MSRNRPCLCQAFESRPIAIVHDRCGQLPEQHIYPRLVPSSLTQTTLFILHKIKLTNMLWNSSSVKFEISLTILFARKTAPCFKIQTNASYARCELPLKLKTNVQMPLRTSMPSRSLSSLATSSVLLTRSQNFCDNSLMILAAMI
jgi:hypothetical protein